MMAFVNLVGHSAKAIPYIERAMRLDPTLPAQYLHFLGTAYFVGRKDCRGRAQGRPAELIDCCYPPGNDGKLISMIAAAAATCLVPFGCRSWGPDRTPIDSRE
jgi:hypothetical protein